MRRSLMEAAGIAAYIFVCTVVICRISTAYIRTGNDCQLPAVTTHMQDCLIIRNDETSTWWWTFHRYADCLIIRNDETST